MEGDHGSITLRAARAGVVTGVLLAVARIAGETAPLLFTALNNQFWTLDLTEPMASLPVTIFKFAMSPTRTGSSWPGPACSSSPSAVLGLNILARVLFRAPSTRNHAWSMDDHARTAASDAPKLSVRDLNFYYGKFHALKNINLEIPEKKVTAFIGPSGCGKSTLLRTFNRMYELYPEQRAEGEIVLDGENLLTSKQDVALIRAKVGMVFQKPTPFPMSIYDNIAFGVRLFENLSAADMDERVEWALRKAALWNEVKDKLQPERRRPLGRPAAAPVHRARHRHQARGAAAGRAVLGARPDLDRQDRGADRRAQERLHRRDRHAQHAAGGARVATTPPTCTWAT